MSTTGDSVVAQKGILPAVLVSHMGTTCSPGGSHCDPILCLDTEKAVEDDSGSWVPPPT